jgi:FkbM family methyltransferase
MKILVLEKIQKLFNVFGFQLRRLDAGVHLDSALEEQLRLAGPNIGCIIEIGAADGRDSRIYAERCRDAVVHAIEPLPSSFAKLSAQAADEPRLHAYQLAVSDSIGTADFHVAVNADSSSLLPPHKTGGVFDKYIETAETIQILTTTLPDFCAEHGISHIDLLKIDAQGVELDILRGAEAMLRNGSISVLYCEVQFERLYEDSCLYHHLASFLEEVGYVLHSLYDFSYDKSGRMVWADAIFVRRVP